MSKRYTLLVLDAEPQTFSRKDAAVRAGEKIGEPFQVFSPSGAVVHEVKPEEPVDEVEDLGTEEPIEFEEQEEDLIGETEEDEAAEGSVQDAEETLKSSSRAKKPADVAKMKAKIAMMLAKAESTTFPEERDTFNAAAEKLMLRLGITVAELESEGKVEKEKIVEVRREYPGNYSISFIPFVTSIANGFGHLTVLQAKTAGLTRIAYIIGHESDVEQFTTLMDSLDKQVMSALHVWQKENRDARRHLTDMAKFLQHRSFIEGFGQMVKKRLVELRQEVEQEASTGAELVLASKDAAVKDWITDTYGELKSGRSARNGSSIGFHAGRVAGATADLGQTGVEGGRAGELAK